MSDKLNYTRLNGKLIPEMNSGQAISHSSFIIHR